MMKQKIMYMELKQEGSTGKDNGPARICRMELGKGATYLYYGEKCFHRVNRAPGCGNYEDEDTGEMYWICPPNKNGKDRCPWAAKVPVAIDEDVREEYWTKIRRQPNKVRNSRT